MPKTNISLGFSTMMFRRTQYNLNLLFMQVVENHFLVKWENHNTNHNTAGWSTSRTHSIWLPKIMYITLWHSTCVLKFNKHNAFLWPTTKWEKNGVKPVLHCLLKRTFEIIYQSYCSLPIAYSHLRTVGIGWNCLLWLIPRALVCL